MNSLTDLYRALQSNARLLSNLAQSLRQSPGVISVHTGLELRNYRSGSVIEAYVEAEMSHGCAVTWWLDVRSFSDGWEFAASILGTDEEGQFTLKHLPKGVAVNLQSASKALFDTVMQA